MSLLNKFQEFIKNNSLVNSGEKILLSISGGPDSLTMLDLFNRIKDDYSLKLVVFHLNHQFRREAAAEAEFVRNFCAKLGIKSIIESFNVPALIEKENMSPEEAARKIRLKLLSEKCQSLSIKKVAIAHNKDDQVETILFNIFRGTGLKGLTGIAPVSEIFGLKIIHPLIDISREQIENYCHQRNLKPRRDPTNEETIYTRNKIRHHIIPYIEKEINPAVKKAVSRTAEILRDEDDYLNREIKEIKDKIIIEESCGRYMLSIPLLAEMHTAIRKRIIRWLIFDLKDAPRNLYYEHVEAVENLLIEGSTGNKLDLADNIKVKRVYDKLIIKKGMFNNVDIDFQFKFPVPGKIKLPDDNILSAEIIAAGDDKQWQPLLDKKEMCFCDARNIKLPLAVRTRKDGDRFYPLGMRGQKKIKDFFIDEKIPVEVRNRIPIIVDNKDRIIWITGLRMDNRFKIKDETEKIIKLYYKKPGDNNGIKN